MSPCLFKSRQRYIAGRDRHMLTPIALAAGIGQPIELCIATAPSRNVGNHLAILSILTQTLARQPAKRSSFFLL